MPLGTANARAGQGAARAMLVPQFCCTHVMQGVPPHACCAPAMNWRLHAAKRSRERAGRPRHSPSPLTSTTAMARGQEHAQCRGTGEVRRVDPCAWERIKAFHRRHPRRRRARRRRRGPGAVAMPGPKTAS
jgi:hypothetical protein